MKYYQFPLTSETSGVRGWFTQYEFYLQSEECSIAAPQLPQVVDQPTADETARHNDFVNRLQRAKCHLITSMSPEVFALLQNLASPESVNDEAMTYTRMKELLIRHLDPKPTVLAERFNFYHAKQVNGETTATYVARLRKIAAGCNFSDFHARMLDQFIMGINNVEAREYLLQSDSSTLTLNTAFEKVMAMDRSRREALILRSNGDNPGPSTANVNKFKDNEIVCTQCGLKGHKKRYCKTKCFLCKRQGHVKKDCKSNKKQTPYKKRDKHVNQVVEHHSESETENFVQGSLFLCEEVESKPEYLNENVIVDLHNGSNINGRAVENVTDNRCVSLHENYGNIRNSTAEINVANDVNDCMGNEFSTHEEVENLNGVSAEISVMINDRCFEFEFDSGASITIVSDNQLKGMDLDLVKSCKKLRVANGEFVQVVWKTLVDARIDGQMRRGLTLYVVKGKFPSLLGRQWISEFCGKDWLQKVRGIQPVVVFKLKWFGR